MWMNWIRGWRHRGSMPQSDRLVARGRWRPSKAIEHLEGRALMSGVTAESLFQMAAQVAHVRQALGLGRFQEPEVPTFRVDSVALGDRSGRVVVRFQGADGGGIEPNSLSGSVSLIRRQSPRVPFPTTLIAQPRVLPSEYLPVNAGPPTTTPTIAAVFDFGQPLPRGTYRLRIESGGIRDLSGQPLDGEYRGRFPSGDGVPGGDFVAVTATNPVYSYRPRAVTGHRPITRFARLG